MSERRCPGQDMRFWTPEDIFEIACPFCGTCVEFWKDDPARFCRACGRRVRNPRLSLGCAAWCPHGDECLAQSGDGAAAAAPAVDRLRAQIVLQFGEHSGRLRSAEAALREAQANCREGDDEPRVESLAALLRGAARPPGATRLDAARLGRELMTSAGFGEGQTATVLAALDSEPGP